MTKKFYKDWIWYYHLILLLVLLIPLILGIYWCVFKEYWYVKYSSLYSASLLNYDILMSFISVQVNIITIVWIFLYLIKYKTDSIFTNIKFRRILLNWNVLNLIVFWIAIILAAVETNSGISSYVDIYTTNQIICTIVTHFICPLSLVIIYPFITGKKYYLLKNIYKGWELYITLIYPFLYLLYILLRGAIYENDAVEIMQWPYPFLNFSDPLINISLFWYLLILVIVFATWYILQHLLILWINNLMYKKKNKRNEVIFEEVIPIIKIKLHIKKVSK